jgi:hypothetical protein
MIMTDLATMSDSSSHRLHDVHEYCRLSHLCVLGNTYLSLKVMVFICAGPQ